MNSVNEKETIDRVKNFSNILLGSVLNRAITSSLDDLADQMEDYYAVLPLPYINPQFEELFPAFLMARKSAYRQKICLDEDPVVSSSTYEETQARKKEDKEEHDYLKDRQLIVTIATTLMHQINDGVMMKESKRNISKELLKPMFFLNFYPRKDLDKVTTHGKKAK